MYSQTATQLVRAPRSAVYAALLDPRATATWRVPDDMTARVAEWEPVARMSLNKLAAYVEGAGVEGAG